MVSGKHETETRSVSRTSGGSGMPPGRRPGYSSDRLRLWCGVIEVLSHVWKLVLTLGVGSSAGFAGDAIRLDMDDGRRGVRTDSDDRASHSRSSRDVICWSR